MHPALAVQTCRSLRTRIHTRHPVLDYTNIRKVFKYDTPGPVDKTWNRWLKVNNLDGSSMRINYGHTQSSKTFRDQLVEALDIMGFRVSKK